MRPASQWTDSDDGAGSTALNALGLGLGLALLILGSVVVANSLLPPGSKLYYTSQPTCNCPESAASPSTPTPAPAPIAMRALPDSPSAPECAFGSWRWRYAVTQVGRQKAVQWREGGPVTEAKGTWVVLQVRLENLGASTASASPEQFALEDGAKLTYFPDASLSYAYSLQRGLADPLSRFPPGVPAEVGLVFDVKPEAGALKFLATRCNRLSVAIGK